MKRSTVSMPFNPQDSQPDRDSVEALFKVPFGKYNDFNHFESAKEYILEHDKTSENMPDNIAPLVKKNLKESDFFLFRNDGGKLLELKKWIADCTRDMIHVVQSPITGIEYNTIHFAESWYHITKTNGHHEAHIHPNCSWCGIYYVDSGDTGEEHGGETVFRCPFNTTYNDAGNRYIDAVSMIRVKPENGLLVLFPSYLEHYQSLYTGKKDRIVIAFNIVVLPKNTPVLDGMTGAKLETY
tara:strand:- start:12 stop:731 length:720 start_codon:yes stop_codon:yes gene_type:complete